MCFFLLLPLLQARGDSSQTGTHESSEDSALEDSGKSSDEGSTTKHPAKSSSEDSNSEYKTEDDVWRAVREGKKVFDDVPGIEGKGPGLEADLELRYKAFKASLVESDELAQKRREEQFVEGYLAGVGDVNFVSERHRFVVGLQMYPVDRQISETLTERDFYLATVPRVALHFGKLYMGFELPFTFTLYNSEVDSANPEHEGGTGFDNAGQYAGLQWKTAADYAHAINYIRYGTKEKRVYLNISKYAATSIGHATLVNRYNPNIELDNRNVSGELDVGLRFGGVEVFTDDVVDFGMIAILGYLRPLAPLLPNVLPARSLSFGLSYAQDRFAPYEVATSSDQKGFLIATGDSTPTVQDYRTVAMASADAEIKWIRKGWIDLKSYLDYSKLLNTGGDGFTLGALTRITLPSSNSSSLRQAFRFRTEVGYYHPKFTAGYFDMFYAIQKFQAQPGADDNIQTKLQFYESQSGDYRPGARVVATYALVDNLAISAALQGSLRGDDNRFIFHAEMPTGKHLRLFLTYSRMNPFGAGDWFTLEDPESILLGKAKLKVLPVMFLVAEVRKMYHLATPGGLTFPLITASEGQAATYKNVFNWMLETEIGFEF